MQEISKHVQRIDLFYSLLFKDNLILDIRQYFNSISIYEMVKKNVVWVDMNPNLLLSVQIW